MRHSYTKFRGKASPRLFYKKSKLRTSLEQQSKILKSLFYFMFKLRSTKIY